jgi:tRNA A-37 threonylcarbamoyl transferase component Bud32
VPRCPTCSARFAAGQRFCPTDGAVLTVTEEVMTATGDDDLVGRVLDRKYRLDEKIGVGGMGAVYRARHLMMDLKVAVKIVRPEVAGEDNAVRRFQREARHSCRLDHVNCVRVTDFGAAEDGTLYLVMEYLDGKTVGEEVYYDGPLSAVRVARIGAQVARALHHAHELGIVHRDLKPDNIMLVRKGAEPDAVKVLDFGLAKLLEREPGDMAVTNPSLGSLTEAGIVFGTPEYMSPEQASGNPLDARTDIYSLGVVMYQMTTGVLPFQGDTFMAILTKHVTEVPMSPSRRRPELGIPLELERVILRCLDKDPARRHATARELGDELDELARQLEQRGGRVPQQVAAAATIDLTAQAAALSADHPTLPVPLGVVTAHVPASIEVTDPIPVPRGAAPRGSRRRGRALLLVAGIIAAGGAAAAVLVRGHGDAARARSSAPPPRPDAALPAPDAAPPPPDAAPPAPDAAPVRPASRAETHVAAAERARRQTNWLKVIAEADQALRAEPGHRRASLLMGEAQLETGDPAMACKYLQRAGSRWNAPALRRRAGCTD